MRDVLTHSVWEAPMSHRYLNGGTLCAIVLITAVSCATPALWERTDPTEYIRVDSEVVSEEELREQGLLYVKFEESGSYHVEKDSARKARDYALRLFGTPVTIAVDAALIYASVSISPFVYLLYIPIALMEDPGSE